MSPSRLDSQATRPAAWPVSLAASALLFTGAGISSRQRRKAQDEDSTAGHGADVSSVGVVAEQRCERALPFALPYGQQLVGRREAAGHRAVERRQIHGLVVALGVEPLARAQAGMGDLDHLARQFRERPAL